MLILDRSLRKEKLNIDRRLQLLLALGGTVVLCLYWRSWRDIAHLFYDIPAGFVVCAFIGQLLCEGIRRQFSPQWWTRVLLMVPISVIPTGRVFLGWNISGHLTDVLAVALIQSIDTRLHPWERLVYWSPLPIVLWIRWFVFDKNGHWETINAAIAAIAIFLCCLAVSYIWTRRINKNHQVSLDRMRDQHRAKT
jgi:hypothetical protein